MRLDHIAFRTKNRLKTAQFFVDTLKYSIQQEFTIDFGNNETAQCLVLEPPEKQIKGVDWVNFHNVQNPLIPPWNTENYNGPSEQFQEYHLAPEIFVSDGSPGSIVANWVDARGGIGGIHHMAYQVKNVEETMKEWKEKGYAEFTSDKPMSCENLIQAFTKPSTLTGIIFELIERGEDGFCRDNVKQLMESTRHLK